MAAIVELREVSVRFRTAHGWGYAVTAVTADIAAGQVTAIIGESGSGKSVLGAAIMGLLPYNAELRGSIRFAGRLPPDGGAVASRRLSRVARDNPQDRTGRA